MTKDKQVIEQVPQTVAPNPSTCHHDLRSRIICSLQQQGFEIGQDGLLPPTQLSKDKIRQLHQMAVRHRREVAGRSLRRVEGHLISRIASGDEVSPRHISPHLVEVLPDSEDELLFRYATLHWSIPVSSGYGRRLRFLVLDAFNEKLIGVIGLGDPVYALQSRDSWIGWTTNDRRVRLSHVLDAFVLGAVPPYSLLLGGKLVAMLAVSDFVRNAFSSKYGGRHSIIQNTLHDGHIALVTTTSALGRSSIYNRLHFSDRPIFQRVGYTRGSGEFHFANGLYAEIAEFAALHCKPTAKRSSWGTGFRNRREVIRKALPALGLSGEWLYHGVEREVFVAPLARNTREFLRGDQSQLHWYHMPESFIVDYFKDRWLLPRVSWDKRYQDWTNTDWLLWDKGAIAQ